MHILSRTTRIILIVLVACIFVRAFVRFGVTHVNPITHRVSAVASPSRPLPKLDVENQKLRQAPHYTHAEDAAFPYVIAIVLFSGALYSLFAAEKLAVIREVILLIKYQRTALSPAETINDALVFYRRPPPVDYVVPI
jgi:hypothetical protein